MLVVEVVVDAKLPLLDTHCQSVEMIQSYQKLKGFRDTIFARSGSFMEDYATASSRDWFAFGDWLGLQTDEADE